MTKLATEKTIAKLAVRIGDRSHDLAQTYLKLFPKLKPAQKAYEEAGRVTKDLDLARCEMIDAGLLKVWPDMLSDLRDDVLDAEDLMADLAEKADELEAKLEEIDTALYYVELELRRFGS